VIFCYTKPQGLLKELASLAPTSKKIMTRHEEEKYRSWWFFAKHCATTLCLKHGVKI